MIPQEDFWKRMIYDICSVVSGMISSFMIVKHFPDESQCGRYQLTTLFA